MLIPFLGGLLCEASQVGSFADIFLDLSVVWPMGKCLVARNWRLGHHFLFSSVLLLRSFFLFKNLQESGIFSFRFRGGHKVLGQPVEKSSLLCESAQGVASMVSFPQNYAHESFSCCNWKASSASMRVSARRLSSRSLATPCSSWRASA